VTLRNRHLFALAVLVAVFVALYPYLGTMGMCDSGECPQIVHSASSGFSTACLIAVVLVVVPVLRPVTAFGWRSATSVLRPIQVFSSPDPPPPQPLPSR
jgi:cytochrome bd-type quinol oxidase subunit 2